MRPIQEWLHHLNGGRSAALLRFALLAGATVILGLGYNVRAYKNLANAEAMDAAQLARNLAEHRGYTTLLVRPLSVYLLQKSFAETRGAEPADGSTDAARVRGLHPDLANPPVYPVLVAGLMKLAPGARFQAAGAERMWNRGGDFWIYRPDFYLSLFNQALMLVAAALVFFLARRWFDATVAWTATLLFLGTDLFWRFSIAGLPTMLLLVIFLGLAWCIALLDEAIENIGHPKYFLLLAAVLGMLAGVGGLTRYACGWLIVPVAAFLLLFTAQRRVVLTLTALTAFAAVMGPWVARNHALSHTFFGTAGFAIYEGTAAYPDDHLERSLHPDVSAVSLNQLGHKLMTNTQTILREELPRLGGNWASAFFFAGLLVSFKSRTLRRLRGFLLLCVPVLVVAQALGRTHLTDDSPVVNSENLLILVAPLVIIFGTAFFFTLLDQMSPAMLALRPLVVGAFCALICLPALLIFVSLRTNVIAYPPYFPPVIQRAAGWMKEDELVMSDVPWAVAWYGRRQSIWLTLDPKGDFYAVDDHVKHVSALYLTPLTMDGRFLTDWYRVGPQSWGSFVYGTIAKNELPTGFPLNKMPVGFLPEQLFLSDTERWAQPIKP